MDTQSKLDPSWYEGIWLGKTEGSDEHIVATRDKVWRTRVMIGSVRLGGPHKETSETLTNLPNNFPEIFNSKKHFWKSPFYVFVSVCF